jgi:DNA-binding GntR family transcriptional regulator
MSPSKTPARRRQAASPSDETATPAAGAARQSLSAVAYEALRARMRSGGVAPGDRLVDLDIAAQLGMSRMPVREALLQMVAEGVLESTARGYRMPVLNRADVLEVFELRRLLEPRAAALAARDLNRAGLARLAAALAEARAAVQVQDFVRMFQANIDFRATWEGAVRNKRLATAISRYADQILNVRHTTLRDPAIQPVVLAGLEELYACFARHDPVGAHDSMVRFVLAAERAYASLEAGDAR